MRTMTLDGAPTSTGLEPRAFLTLAFSADAPARAPQRFALEGVTCVTVGRGRGVSGEIRADDLDVEIDDGTLSRPHFRLQHEGEWVLRDAGSKNGTWVDGDRVTEAPLSDGSVIFAGKCVLVFRRLVVEPAPPPLPGAAPPAFTTLHPALEVALARLRRAAREALPVLVLGETGTGKEVLARAIHEASGRPGAFLAVNCGAVPPSLLASELFGAKKGAFTGAAVDRPGMFRAAHQGTLLLDEIGDMPADGQVALLRVLQEREVTPLGDTNAVRVDTRVVAATHRDLAGLVRAGKFREDLHARLAGVTVALPPLRERREDLGTLIAGALAAEPGAELTVEAARTIFLHRWPRNIRQLLSTLGVALADRRGPLEAARLRELADPNEGGPGEGEGDAQPPVTAERLAELLRDHAGNLSAVARALSTSRTHVMRLLARHGLARVP